MQSFAYLQIQRDIMLKLPERGSSYLMLVAESPSFSGRKKTRVLVSKRRGNIFIQTDQPIYNPTQMGKTNKPVKITIIDLYRVYLKQLTVDHFISSSEVQDIHTRSHLQAE